MLDTGTNTYAPWERATKFDARGASLADRHYSRRTVGSPQFMPPGETLILIPPCGRAVYGWWRPHPASGLKAMNGLDGWTCTIFRNESEHLSSEMILAAERALVAEKGNCGPSGMLTYVFDKKVATEAQRGRARAGWCFRKAGWAVLGRSADGKKTLLGKPYEMAGQ